MKHCCDCIYWKGEPFGYWESSNTGNSIIKCRLRCKHPKHYNQPKRNNRKACKYFEQKEIKSIIIAGTYNEYVSSGT